MTGERKNDVVANRNGESSAQTACGAAKPMNRAKLLSASTILFYTVALRSFALHSGFVYETSPGLPTLLLSLPLRTAARWAPKLQVHQKAHDLRAPMMGIYVCTVNTTAVTDKNQLQFSQTKLHSLLMSVVLVVQSKMSPVRYG